MQITGKRCYMCGKGRKQRNLRSHSKRMAIRYAKPNLRKMRIKVGAAVKAVWVCAKCLKLGRLVPTLPRRLTRPEPTSQ